MSAPYCSSGFRADLSGRNPLRKASRIICGRIQSGPKMVYAGSFPKMPTSLISRYWRKPRYESSGCVSAIVRTSLLLEAFNNALKMIEKELDAGETLMELY